MFKGVTLNNTFQRRREAAYYYGDFISGHNFYFFTISYFSSRPLSTYTQTFKGFGLFIF